MANKASMTGNSNRPKEFTIRLRPVVNDDLPTLYQNQLDPDAVRMAVVNPRDANSFDAHWARILEDKTVTARAILADEVLVGCISSFVADGQCSVGYWIAKEHWGRGIATRALALLLQQVTTRPLYARVASQNTGSIRVLTRNGFTIKSYRMAPDDDRYPACEEALLELE
jgi:RimJ/RimL family protein N-acetyltransferase